MAIVNRDQAEHWNNTAEVGQWVTEQARYDVMLAPFTEMLIAGATIGPGDTVLDIGCGCGATTLAAARTTQTGYAVGVDLSVAMLERARVDAATAGLANVTFEQADAQVHPFEGGAFDVVISRFGVMFFADPVAAFINLRRAARSDGRLAFVCWQPLAANEWLAGPGAALATVVPIPDLGPPGGPGLFAFADPDRVRDVLTGAGWRGVTITERRTPILVGGIGTLDEAVSFLRNGSLGRTMLAGADSDTETQALDAVRASLRLMPTTTASGSRPPSGS
jgi:SAM-dependent methyltransferase